MDYLATATAFAVGLRNVQRPLCCPFCFDELADLLDDMALEELRTTCHDFWNGCIGVVTALRTGDDSDFAALEEHFTRVAQRCTNRLHRVAAVYSYVRTDSPRSDLYCTFFAAVFQCVFRGLTGGDKAVTERTMVRPQHGFNSRRNHTWPTSVADLFPVGERETVQALIFWCTQLISPHPLNVISQLLVVARPILLPLLMQEPEHGRLVWSLVQCLDPVTTTRALPAHSDPNIWPGGQAPCENPRNWLSLDWIIEDEGRWAYGAAAMFLFNLRVGVDSSTEDGDNFTIGYEGVLLPFLQRGILAVHNDDDGLPVEDLSRQLVHYVNGIQERLQLADSTLSLGFRRVRHAIKVESAKDFEFSVATPILLYLHLWYKNRACFGPDCALPVQRNVASSRPFPFCSGCKFARYCSKTCQKRDWKELRTPGLVSAYSHKELCPVYRRLLAQPGLSMNQESGIKSFQEAFHGPDVCIDDHDLEVLLSIAMESDIPKVWKLLVIHLIKPAWDKNDWEEIQSARFTSDEGVLARLRRQEEELAREEDSCYS
ncbi:hypothetical protein EXIGLDRAFT_841450 [Exidia glandulosa HHB12029]|uniref:MYND-type domain-containing protein n=1 Tax=Exidia glandulosa HHB12029 TaxID=1314781 RepID=A0A165DVM5_EXIGL|nr:hypothetical protein EXIGLDRAFT_841450 [Exidia glandulosa HHB12029]